MSAALAAVLAGAAVACAWPVPPVRRLRSPAAQRSAPHVRRRWWGGRGAAASERPVGAGDVPIALDLIAVCLAAGATQAAALAAVAGASPGRLGQDLATVARALDLGSTSVQAWSLVTADAAGLQQAAARFGHAENSGSALGPALAVLAEDLRSSVHLRRARAARRVGVLAAGPLGLCFLPAFVLVGVLPVVAGLVSGLALS